MESMGEFDRECPMVKRFCQHMSEDDFDKQGLTYTQQALHELFTTMERQPELCERVIRRRKQKELEQGQGPSSIKAKFFSVVEGQMNRCNKVGADELRDRVGQLRAEMARVQAYAQEAKCATKRSSQHLANKWQKSLKCTAEERPAPTQCCGISTLVPPPPPPPPPLPPLPATPRQEHSQRQQATDTPSLLASYGLSQLNRLYSSSDFSKPQGNHTERSRPHRDIHTELLSYDPARSLKATGIVRSPGGTPTSRAPIRALKPSPRSVFNTALLSKFENTQSPPQGSTDLDAQTSDSEEDGFATPPGSP